MATGKILIDFWDVGQGDCTVITLPDGQLFIIDVGPASSPLINWLGERQRRIHSVAITHNDDDHAGALPSLVKTPSLPIGQIYMLCDRDKKAKAFQNIYRPVREEHKNPKRKLPVWALTANTTLWERADLGVSLKVVFPTFVGGIDASRPNETSGVICWYCGDEVRIIWPGDAPMRVLADKCGGTSPFLLHGPHHGAPVDREKPDFNSWVTSIHPERVFISVGTRNGDTHPSVKYIAKQVSQGCVITCTQLTRHCDNENVTHERPVLQTAALLGLRPPNSGVQCRGCMRVTYHNGNFLPDPWDAEHRKRISLLRRPQCLK